MTTPIYDFVKKYADSAPVRFHMPAHKGKSFLGCEKLDITEIDGADVLYSADGIIAESEDNASRLFGSAHTFYSTEGSTLCIKAMLALVAQGAPRGQRPLIVAARNVHKAFIYACALLDIDVKWIYPSKTEHLCVCRISKDDVKEALSSCDRRPAAFYLTSPDYLGNMADIREIADVCDEYGLPLLIDNAHGAYLKFLTPSLHPLDLGASMSCDSAHKTLPVLTGGAYLHIASKASEYVDGARSALSLFASTSPSYLILQSLDLCNRYLSDGYRERLDACIKYIENVKSSISIPTEHSEPLKLTLSPANIGYTGIELSEHLRDAGIECEFADGEYVVLMISPENSEDDLSRLAHSLSMIVKKQPINTPPAPPVRGASSVMSIREAVLAKSERVRTADALGMICAAPTVSCPPAVPIALSGERIDENMIAIFDKYGIDEIEVVKQ